MKLHRWHSGSTDTCNSLANQVALFIPEEKERTIDQTMFLLMSFHIDSNSTEQSVFEAVLLLARIDPFVNTYR